MNIRQAMKIQASANSAVKLTKAAEAIIKGDRKVVDKSLNNYKVTDWFGLAQNPLLTDSDIRRMYSELNQAYASDKADKKMTGAVQTRNNGNRGKVKKLLSLHPSLGAKSIESLLSGSSFGTPTVLNNPNVTVEQLDNYFQKKIMTTAQGKGYNFVTFNEIMKTKNITKAIVLKWYKELALQADWTYKDNQWYSIVDAYLGFDDCPYEVLVDICKAPAGLGDGSFFDRPEDYRKRAMKHKNAKEDLEDIAYEATQFEQYLPSTVRDIFIF